MIVSHLQYADGTLILIDNSTSGLRNVMMMIQCFELAMDSGLKLIRGKETVGLGIDQSEISNYGLFFGLQIH